MTEVIDLLNELNYKLDQGLEQINQILGLLDYRSGDEAIKEVLPKQVSLKTVKPFKDFKTGEYEEKVTGRLNEDPVQAEVDTRFGKRKVANFKISDGENLVRLSLWGDIAEEVMSYTTGNIISVTNISVKSVYEGVPQLSSTRNTEIVE